jgi:hypothetical protein
VHTGFWWENLRKRNHLKTQVYIDGLYSNGSSGHGGMDWIDLAEDRDR